MIWRSISRTTKTPILVLMLLALFAGANGQNRNPCFDVCVSGVLDLDLSACNIGAAKKDVEDLKICLDTVKEDLLSLDLNDNTLCFLPVDLFTGLSKVTHLRLQGNQLTTLPAGIFGPLSSLELLDMERNSHLQCLPTTTASTVFPGDHSLSSSPCQCTSGVAVSYNCGEDECMAGHKGYVCGHSIITRSPSLSGPPAASRRQLLPKGSIDAAEACADFAMVENEGSSWALDDCMNVWEHFSLSLSPGLLGRFRLIDVWRDTASKLRKANKPCLVAPEPPHDGVGSSTIRHLADWIFSEQMGCDWVTPDWGLKPLPQGNGNGTVVYCHRTATAEEMENTKSLAEQMAMRRCTVVNWLSYFQFDVPSVALPQGEKLKYVEPTRNADSISGVQNEVLTTGLSNRPWDRVVFTMGPSFTSEMLLNEGSWDEPKRTLVRRILHEARENFHRHPREWYDESPKCAFNTDRLHFAVHVRMGDRREFLGGGNSEYFDLLERIMATISTEVVGKGLPQPHFHIFSETLAPCPSEETGLFDEFPTWPLSEEEVLECWAAPVPDDCPHQRRGVPCFPDRDGVFNVVQKNIVLHVGADVQDDLSCMTQADGVLMGCSTFGQVAGILSKGISMFSLDCGGSKTPFQYKSIPPIAVAEMGRLWVPIAGSWRDPILTSASLFRRALDDLLSQRGSV